MPAEVVTVKSRCWTFFSLEDPVLAAEIRWDIIRFVKCWLRNRRSKKVEEGSMEMGKNEKGIRHLLLYAVQGRRNTLGA